MNTTYFMNVIQGNVFGTQTSPALPSIYYIGLSTTLPLIDGTNVTEPSGNGYAWITMTGLSTPTNGLITNTTALTFPESTGAWGTLTHYVIYGNTTGTNLLMFGELSSAKTIDAAEEYYTLKASGIELQLSNIT